MIEAVLLGDEIKVKEDSNIPWLKMSPEEFDQMLAEEIRRENERKENGT